MNKEELIGTFHTLLDEQYLEADYALLKKQDPKNQIVSKPLSPNQGREALLELIELVGEEEITKHRKGFATQKKKAAAIARKAKQLAQKESLLEQLEEGKLKEVRDAVDNLPEDHLFLDDLVKVLEKAEAAAAKEAEEAATLDKEEILLFLKDGKLAEAEAIFRDLPEDHMYLNELANAINNAKTAAREKAEAETALEEATAEKESIEKLLEDEKLEEAKTAIEGLPDDHVFIEELQSALEEAMEKASSDDKGAGDQGTDTGSDENSGAESQEKSDEVTAKKKVEDTQGASSKKNKSTQGSGGTT